MSGGPRLGPRSDEPSPLQVLVADDELMARRRLLRLLGELRGVVACGECANGAEVLKRVAAGGVDVVLLDIHMPQLTGLEALRLMPPGGPYVIFCTAHAAHAVDAFDAGALDYLLKPIERGRLERALERAHSQETLLRFRAEVERQRDGAPVPSPAAARRASGPSRTPSPALERLAISTRAGIELVDPREVSHAVLEDELVTVTGTRGTWLTDLTLQELERRLPPSFVRVHRRALLNLELVLRLEPTETGGFVARTRAGAAVEVSRQAARELRRRLGLRRSPGERESEAGGGDEDAPADD